MSAIELPALRGADPLGFLAALGVLTLASHAPTGPPPRLAFGAGPAYTARLHRPGGLDDLVDLLATQARALNDADGTVVLPGLDVEVAFPPAAPAGPDTTHDDDDQEAGPKQTRKRASRPPRDPVKMTRAAYRAWAYRAQRAELAGKPALAAWLTALVTELGQDHANGNRDHQGLTRFYFVGRNATLHGVLADALRHGARDREELASGLQRWRRRAGFTGAYLDHRALSTAADNPTGAARMRGAPAPTWLALMALPLFGVVGTGQRPVTKGWQRVRTPAGPREVFAWPLWSAPLDLAAVRVLLDAPWLTLTADADTLTLAEYPARLDAWGVTAVFASQRRRQGNGRDASRYLGPAEPVWAATQPHSTHP